MAIVMAALAATVLIGIPAIASFQPRERSPLASILRQDAEARGQQVTAFGPASLVTDGSNDLLGAGGGAPSSDLVMADVGWIAAAPDWLLEAFDCTSPGVSCGDGERLGRTFHEGAFVFFERVAAGPEALPADRIAEWGPILGVGGAPRASGYPGLAYPGASHAFITRRAAGHDELVLVRYTNKATFEQDTTSARSIWVGADLLTLIPAAELGGDSISWDAYAADRASDENARWSYDILREAGTMPLLHLDLPTMFMTLPTPNP
jgi:hypothetical protein